MTDQSQADQPSVTKPHNQFLAELEERKDNFRAVLPKQVTEEKFSRVVTTAVSLNPALARADRRSFWNSAMQAATDGLLPDGREGALVIFQVKEKDADGRERWIDKVQWMPMAAGIRKKVRNSGELRSWETHVVHQRDEFDYELGDHPHIRHKPFFSGDPGPLVAAYSVAILASGEISREVMTRAEIEKVKAVSRAKSGPWGGWYDEMARKTVLKRHSKSLPMSTDLEATVNRDDELTDMRAEPDRLPPPPRGLSRKLDVLAGEDELLELSEEEQALRLDLVETASARAAAGSTALNDFMVGLNPREMETIGMQTFFNLKKQALEVDRLGPPEAPEFAPGDSGSTTTN